MVTAALLNTHLRDNLIHIGTDLKTSPGFTASATGSLTLYARGRTGFIIMDLTFADGLAANATIFTLPSEHLPPATMNTPAQHRTGGGQAVLGLSSTNGAVYPLDAIASGGRLLDLIAYPLA